MLQLIESQKYFACSEGASNQLWRLGLMNKLMEMKQRKYMEVKDYQRITTMLDSLCST